MPLVEFNTVTGATRPSSSSSSLRRSRSRSFAATPPRRCRSFSRPTARVSGSIRHRSSLRTRRYPSYRHPPPPAPRAQQYSSSRASSSTRRTSSEHPSFAQPMASLVRGLSISSLTSALGGGAGVPPIDDDTPTVSVAVPMSDLRGAVDNGLRKRSSTLFHRLMKRRVRVEASVDGVKDFVFYAPEGDPTNRRATPTEFVKTRPTPGDNTIVRRCDSFEISFVGMSVIPEDTIFSDKNELLLYSLKTNPEAIYDVIDDAEKLRENDSDDLHSELTDVDAPIVPTSGFSLSPDDIPFIHYDPVVDGHDVGSAPNSFIPVPASKSLFFQHSGRKSKKPINGLASVPLRFNVLEIDRVSDGQARAVGSVGELGKMVKSTGIPYLQPLSMAVNAAAALGREGLKNYSKPDHVMSKDLVFLLAEPEEDDNTSSGGSNSSVSNRVETYGNFLRYGYYFFLGKKVDAKLYAQTGSSSQTVPLLLRRHPFTKEMRLRDEKEFFPLTGVSYVCVKVSAGCSRKYERNLKMMEKEHRSRLENMLQMSDAIQMLANVQRAG